MPTSGSPTVSQKASGSVVLVAIVALLVQLGSLFARDEHITRRSLWESITSAIPSGERSGLENLITQKCCLAGDCGGYECSQVSNGETRGLPAYVAKCTWTDASSSGVKKCAYVHYVTEKGDNNLRTYFSRA
jgi:hypothetical protein